MRKRGAFVAAEWMCCSELFSRKCCLHFKSRRNIKGYQGTDYDFQRPQLAVPLNAKENAAESATAVCVWDYLGFTI